nr:hypothetical protein [Pseudomonas sp. BIGb0427]
MTATLNNPALVQHQDLLGMADALQAVGNDQPRTPGRPSCRAMRKARSVCGSVAEVGSSRSMIGALRKQRPGDGQALQLAARQLHIVTGYARVALWPAP